jgi:hypothetical protein
MEALAILRPTLALAIWTLLVFTLIPLRRFRAIGAGEVSANDFRMGESERVPAYVSLPNKNIINLFQMPVLFYLACLLLFITKLADQWFVYLAWAYVGLRVAHSIVHVSYNNVRHRFIPFALSNFVLLAIWIRLVWVMS